MRSKTRIKRERLSFENLERRSLLTVSAQPDYVNVALPADASSFPSSTVDVLANDLGTNVRIESVGTPAVGTVERLAGAGPNGRELLRYVPGPTFRGYDSFQYTAIDDAGRTETQHVFVSYSQDPVPYSPWAIVAPTELAVSANKPFRFVGADGQALVSVDYDGILPAQVGVLLRWPVTFFGSDTSVGDLSTGVTRDDASFYAYPSGYAWLFGSIEGVNALLGDLTYTAGPGFSATDGVRLTVQAHLYSNLVVNIDTKFSDIDLRVSLDEGAPALADDSYLVESLTDAAILDVLANDSPGRGASRLGVLEVQLPSGSTSTTFVTPGGQSVTYLPGPGFMGTERLVYSARNEAGLVSRAYVDITVRTDVFAVATLDGLSTLIEVFDQNTGRPIADFQPFGSGYSGNLILDLADMNGDGQQEIVAMQAEGERRMRVFDMFGTVIVDEVVNPFAGRGFSGMDMAMGDMDNDGKSEMVFAASTSRGTEVRAMDSETMQPEMTVFLRGMVGVPQVAMDDDTDRLSVLGRTARGGVTMAMLSAGSSAAGVTRRTILSDRDVRNLTRRNGSVSDVTLVSGEPADQGPGPGSVRISFRNGLVRTIALDDRTGMARGFFDRRLTEAGVDMVMASIGLAMTPGGQWVWSLTDTQRRSRIRAVAID